MCHTEHSISQAISVPAATLSQWDLGLFCCFCLKCSSAERLKHSVKQQLSMSLVAYVGQSNRKTGKADMQDGTRGIQSSQG